MQPKKQKKNMIFWAWVSKVSKVELFSSSKTIWKPNKMEENLSLTFVFVGIVELFWCWWYSFGATIESLIHELNNWMGFWHFMLDKGRILATCWACPFCNLFGNARYIHVHKPLDLNVLQKCWNGKTIQHSIVFNPSKEHENMWEVKHVISTPKGPTLEICPF